MGADVVPLRPAGDAPAAAAGAFALAARYLDRCKLAARTVRSPRYERSPNPITWFVFTLNRDWGERPAG